MQKLNNRPGETNYVVIFSIIDIQLIYKYHDILWYLHYNV